MVVLHMNVYGVMLIGVKEEHESEISIDIRHIIDIVAIEQMKLCVPPAVMDCIARRRCPLRTGGGCKITKSLGDGKEKHGFF